MRLIWQILLIAGLGTGAAGAWYGIPALHGNGPQAAAPDRAARPVNVVAEPARIGEIATVAEAVGTLRANEAVTVNSKQTGIIRAIRFDEGQWVERGSVLIELDDAEARAQLAVAEADRRNARQLLERSRTLLTRQAVAEARVDELTAALDRADAAARAARARLQELVVTAPFAGQTGLRRVSPGALVTSGTAITTLDDIRTVKLDFRVPEAALGGLRPGLAVSARSPAFPGETFTGVVSVIDTRVDPVTRAVEVVAALPNDQLRLRPGMFMNVGLTLSSRADAVLIAEEALVPLGERQFVFVVTDGHARRRAVTIGQRHDGMVEVVEGVEPGELVVVRGTQRVRDGAPVKAEREPPSAARPAAGS
ncbi:efflux RND transporter periplasmic adaptor subunit [Skermanella mucosa]|uniref:efflux RND transporter periplasmic adaptor subunit n=1 Tax=Skermanella mucosa TaxID=1789672 RepID=UPI00192CABF5|nr:efflux RND transporter periplasmic adaptor subunit [Skermanella mucosa]UEM22652.1 efflux RND transporter periplasmic adaptor subunit [Skermanella mucosa]